MKKRVGARKPIVITPKEKKLSRAHKPDGMALEEWQIQLRRQYAREQNFKVRNAGGHPVFSDFEVTNPETGRTYRVAIRSEQPGLNYCSCPDFAVNTLGTCKHIEFVLFRLSGNRRNQKLLKEGLALPYSSVYLRYGPQRSVGFRAGTEAPSGLKRLAAGYFDRGGVLKNEAYGLFDHFLQQAGRFDHELRCYDDALTFISRVRDAEHRRTVIDDLYRDGDGKKRLEARLKARLYPYQYEGALFAARSGRCLIADEMGLGKTVQVIAAAEIMAADFGIERVLIVCPTSLKYQWKHEIEKFCSRQAVVIEGLSQERKKLYAAEGFYKIVNYELVYRDLGAILAMAPDLIVLDEAQRIKNWKTRTARSVKRLESDYAIVLTGTPLENRLEELHSIVEFVDRFKLGPLFKFLAGHQVQEKESARVVGYRKLNEIGETLSSVLLRRKKDEVLLQLPGRLQNNYFVPMTKEQWDLHDENREIVARIVAKWKKYRFISEADQRRLTIALQYMRMACDNTYLIDRETRFGPKLDEVGTLLGEVLERPGAKVVLFSQWQRMHDLIAGMLAERGIPFVYLHGGVPGRKRKDLITSFREDPKIRVFLSTDAGGLGLNLQTASTVVNMDLPWNPAVLEQRIGRVHRIGQHRPVQVVNFVSQGTIEHGMLDLLEFKKSLFTGVLEDGKDEVFLGGSRLTRFMEMVETATGAIPATAHEPPPAESAAEEGEVPEDEPVVPEPVSSYQPLLESAALFFKELGSFVQKAREPGRPGPASLFETDRETGQSYLKIPMPDPKAVERIVEAVGPLLQMLGRSRDKK
jgi:superfamily II DNA or RNA helicase